MKNRLFDLAKFLVSVVLLGLVLARVDRDDLLRQLRSANVSLLALALTLFILGVPLRAFRWRALLSDRGLNVPVGVLTRLYFVGQFFNTFLPTGFGGDVMRAVELARYGVSKAESVSTVFLDRMSGLMAFFLMTLVALPFAGGMIPQSIRLLLMVFGAGGVVGTWLMFERRWTTPLIDGLFARVNFPFKAKVVRLYESMRANSPRATLEAMLIGFTFNLLLVGINYTISRAFGLDLSIGYFFLFVPIISTLLLLPVGVNGLGVREWSYVALFVPVNVSGETATAMSLSFWAITVATGLIGGVLSAMQGARGAINAGAAAPVSKEGK